MHFQQQKLQIFQKEISSHIFVCRIPINWNEYQRAHKCPTHFMPIPFNCFISFLRFKYFHGNSIYYFCCQQQKGLLLFLFLINVLPLEFSRLTEQFLTRHFEFPDSICFKCSMQMWPCTTDHRIQHSYNYKLTEILQFDLNLLLALNRNPINVTNYVWLSFPF